MTRKFAVIVLLVAGILGWVAAPAFGQAACDVSPSGSTTATEVSDYITECLSVSAQVKTALAAATTTAINNGNLSAEDALRMLQRLEGSSASQDEKESILSTIGSTLSANIPADLLISEVEQGIAFGFSGSTIAANVTAVAGTLSDVNTLLQSKGLKANYSRSQLDPVITAMADALEDYIANSSNPGSDARDAESVAEFVFGRLDQLAGRSLDANVVAQVKANVQDDELSTLAVNVCSRRGSC